MKSVVKPKFSVHNRFDIFVNKKQVAYAENIILDNYFSNLAVFQDSSQSRFTGIAYGTGTGTLSEARTTLFTHLGYKSAGNELQNLDIESGVFSIRKDITLIETEHIGAVLTEVGIGGTTIYTHALLCDMNGNPTSITKTATDIIKIYATVYVVIDFKTLAEQGLIFKNHWTNNYQGKGILHWAQSGDSYQWSLACKPIRAAARHTLQTWSGGYTPTTTGSSNALKKMCLVAARVPAADNNGLPGIFGFAFGTSAGVTEYDYFYTKILGVLNAVGFDIVGETVGNGNGLVSDFNTTWQLASIDKVYVDGVEVTSGVTKDTRKITGSAIEGYFGYIGHNWDGDRTINGTGLPYPGSTSNSAYKFHTVYYENLISEYCGITSMIIGKYSKLYASTDFTNWVLIDESTDANKTVSIGATYQHYKYWKRECIDARATAYWASFVTDDYGTTNIHFATPPGAITAEAVGTGDAVEVDFTLDHEPIAGSLTVKLDGVTTTDYTLANGIITFNTAPGAGVAITADYRYACVVTVDYNTLVCPKDANHVFDYSVEINYDRYVAP